MSRTPRAAPEGFKWCNRCQDYKPLSQFGQNSTNRDGLQYYCKVHQQAEINSSRERAKDYRLSKLRQLISR